MDNGNGNPTPGGSGTGRTVPVQAQNVVIDANAQAAAAQMAHQILANTNVTLKQELVKIPDFWGEKGKDTVTPTQFMARIDECQIANDWNDTTTYANFSLCLRGEADEWLASKVRLLDLTPAQKGIRCVLRRQAHHRRSRQLGPQTRREPKEVHVKVGKACQYT